MAIALADIPKTNNVTNKKHPNNFFIEPPPSKLKKPNCLTFQGDPAI
jgi:hypothetical protein